MSIDHFADVSLNQWMALTSWNLVKAHLNLDDRVRARPEHPQTHRGSAIMTAEFVLRAFLLS